jgi:predicted aspartyl protease
MSRWVNVCPMKTIWIMASVPYVLTAMGLQGCTMAPSTCQAASVDVPVTFVDGVPTIPVTVDGLKFRFMIDSGAYISTLTPRTVELLNSQSKSMPLGGVAVGVGGRVVEGSSQPGDFKIDALRVSHEIFSVAELSSSDAPATRIDGLLGADILSQNNFALDFPHNRFMMFPLGACPSEFPFHGQFVDVPYHSTDEAGFIISVAVDGHDIDAAIDTGAYRTAYDRFDLTRAGVQGTVFGESHKVEGFGAKTTFMQPERFDSMTIGAEEIDNDVVDVLAAQHDDDAISLLGEDYLRHHQVFVSRDTAKVWLGLWMPASGTP